jgi:M6 family metalloprotease-like protein
MARKTRGRNSLNPLLSVLCTLLACGTSAHELGVDDPAKGGPVGHQHALVVAANYLDDTGEDLPIDEIRDRFFGATDSLAGFWAEASYGKLTLTGDIYGWLTLNITKQQAADLCANNSHVELTTLAAKAAADRGADWTRYNAIHVVLRNPGTCSFGGITSSATIEGIRHHGGLNLANVFRTQPLRISAMEATHIFGVPHASTEDNGTAIIRPVGEVGALSEYGNPFDVMGGIIAPNKSGHIQAGYKHNIGWLEDQDVVRVVDQGTFVIEPLSSPLTGLKAVNIIRGHHSRVDTAGFHFHRESLWLETRADIGYDSRLDPRGYGRILINRKEADGTRMNKLIDANPESAASENEDVYDSGLAPGQTFVDRYNGITIENLGVDATNGNVTVRVSIDPAFVHTDEDYIVDGQEIAFGTDPALTDTDGDGADDLAEICYDEDCASYQPFPGGGDLIALSSDTDGDGLPDGWELAHKLNPLAGDAAQDADNDGLSNAQEYALGTSPRSGDSDDDGLTDVDELNTRGTDPTDADSDDDGLPDGWELSNGFSPTGVDESALDGDGDGLSNLLEYLRKTDPGNSDTDGDGLDDGEEVNSFGTNPRFADTDKDGHSDAEELDRGSDALDPASLPLPPPGDLNNDGRVDVSDLLLATRLAVNLQTTTSDHLVRGDLYPAAAPDGVIDVSDLLMIQGLVLSGGQ